MTKYEQLIKNYISDSYHKILREPKGLLNHKLIAPGACYDCTLWDWDSWITDVAITPVARENGSLTEFAAYQKGCIINFCEHIDEKTGWLPVMIGDKEYLPKKELAGQTNCSKPVLVQHALFIGREHDDYGWLADCYPVFERYLQYWRDYCMHESGLFFYIDDTCIGVDNDPCTYFRPKRSSGSIFINCLMYKELLAMEELSEKLGYADKQTVYATRAQELKQAIRSRCYDERNGFYYSVDLNLVPVDPNQWLHSGFPRNWDTLIQRIDVWSGFLAMWAGIATDDEAKRMVEENYKNPRTFYSNYGVRSLSCSEKMYQIVESGNPSCWLGPIWGIANYLVFRGLLRYGYEAEARELLEKTVEMFGRDIEACGEMHEYYHPDTGEGVYNAGFQSWNLLCGNMIDWKETGHAVCEV